MNTLSHGPGWKTYQPFPVLLRLCGGEQGVTASPDRYFAKPASVPGYFVLWDRRSNLAVYGFEFATKILVEGYARRLNEMYRQFLKDQAARS